MTLETEMYDLKVSPLNLEGIVVDQRGRKPHRDQLHTFPRIGGKGRMTKIDLESLSKGEKLNFDQKRLGIGGF